MFSESARMCSAAEARFRVQAPNSMPRATTVIALDEPSEGVIRRLAEARWSQATFLTAAAVDASGTEPSLDGWLTDLAGHRTSVQGQVNAADQVIMVATAGGNARAAPMVGHACSLKRVTTTALIVGAASVSDTDVSRTLAQLRPWSLMVVIANTDDYIVDLMTALRV